MVLIKNNIKKVEEDLVLSFMKCVLTSKDTQNMQLDSFIH